MSDSLTTMRVSYQTIFYGDSEIVVGARRVLLKRFEGQEKKYNGKIRLPRMALVDSTAGAKSGKGIELREDVSEGQIIAIYARNIISESTAQIRKDKVHQHTNTQKNNLFRFTLGSCRAIGTFVIITTRAVAWTLSQLQCVGTSITVVVIRLLDLPIQLFVPMRISRMLGSTLSWWPRGLCARGLRCLWTTHFNPLRTRRRWACRRLQTYS
jgi:hypothetical protein